ncbi:hypothetical protein O6H91_07G129100 [Diphasiastrum complanatum]|uniref:Uncharacterized protein n=1 Tax=Diphasiastrum complanatum TaxID=34168 RepID=A0ACC2DA65_DIPCM|nr:hypothetical protein O6H91_07G129100 [Diphasiastrum complanatum]
MSRLVSMPSRAMGTSESNWCRAVKGGTGITVIGLLFAKQLDSALVEAAIESLLAEHPLLRAEVQDRDGKPWFMIYDTPAAALEEIDRSSESPGSQFSSENAEAGSEQWLQIVEDEMNTSFSKQNPFRVFQCRLYRLPRDCSLLVIRVHAAGCDLASSSSISPHIIKFLLEFSDAEKHGQSLDDFLRSKNTAHVESVVKVNLPAMESCIPKKSSRKPFWAHGVDMIGYGLLATKHAYLPLENTDAPRRSRLVRSIFSRDSTRELIHGCSTNATNLFGALSAACMKAVAAFKKVGDKGEHYGSAVLLNCREMLDPAILPSSVGFYHSAMLRTLHVTESTPFWKLAKKCSDQVEEAIKNSKHFTDMWDLNTLMVQAMNFPNLTPSGSLRTTLLSLYYDPIQESFADAAASSLNLKDCVTCSSIGGVGPCLAMFPFLRDGCLHISFIYCSPLFSQFHIQNIVDKIKDLLTQ